MSDIHSIENIYEKLMMDIDTDGDGPSIVPSFEKTQEILEGLTITGYLSSRPYNDDQIIYEPRPGLSWPNFDDLNDPIKKQILMYFVKNPKTIFVLYNTQKGKSRICSIELTKASKEPGVKVVGIVIVDNDQTLGEQSRQGFEDVFKKSPKDDPPDNVFILSSGSGSLPNGRPRPSVDGIINYINCYAADVIDEYKMPVIVALQNDVQLKKIIKILISIKSKVHDLRVNSKLRYCIIVDECDKTYPPIRERILPFISDPVALHQIIFVSATEGDLLDDYEECFNAKFYNVENGDSPHYRAMHTEDAEIKEIKPKTPKQKPNDYAEMILSENRDHFYTPITLPSGEQYYRKIIVNGNTNVKDMCNFAKERVAEGAYGLTFNQSGVTVYRPNEPAKRFRTKGKRFNEVLMFIYETLNLKDRPIFIIGRRKVDRGLGFHYAPKSPKPETIIMLDKTIAIENGNGLIFTDMILGHIDNRPSAIQKAGRLAGIIAQCPQYPGKIVYWTDSPTKCIVINHNRMVDEANRLPGTYNALEATTRARENIDVEVPTLPEPKDKPKPLNDTFATAKLAKTYCDAHCTYTYMQRHRDKPATEEKYGSSEYKLYKKVGDKLVKCTKPNDPEATHMKCRTHEREILNEKATRDSGDLGFGVASSARIMPVRAEDGSIKYIVIAKPKPVLEPIIL